jgi:hypothetical protein
MANTKPTTTSSKKAAAKSDTKSFEQRQRIHAAQILLNEGGIQLDQSEFWLWSEVKHSDLVTYLGDIFSKSAKAKHDSEAAKLFNSLVIDHLGFGWSEVVPSDVDPVKDQQHLKGLVAWTNYIADMPNLPEEQLSGIISFLAGRSLSQRFLDSIKYANYQLDPTDYLRLQIAVYAETDKYIGEFTKLVTTQQLEQLKIANDISKALKLYTRHSNREF